MFKAGIQVLVVDDMTTMRKLVIKCCKEIGFSNFLEAKDGAEAWAIVEKASPAIELVISDWNMPNCTGLDFLKKVRADARFKNMPFLLVTAEAEQKQVLEAIQAGVDNYVVKPFSAGQLREKLEVVSKKRGAG